MRTFPLCDALNHTWYFYTMKKMVDVPLIILSLSYLENHYPVVQRWPLSHIVVINCILINIFFSTFKRFLKVLNSDIKNILNKMNLCHTVNLIWLKGLKIKASDSRSSTILSHFCYQFVTFYDWKVDIQHA